MILRQRVGKQPNIVDVPPSEMAADRKQLLGPDVGELAVRRHVEVHRVKPVDGSGGVALGDEVGGGQLALPISPGIVGVCDELAVPEARFDGCAVAVTVNLHGSEGWVGYGWRRRRPPGCTHGWRAQSVPRPTAGRGSRVVRGVYHCNQYTVGRARADTTGHGVGALSGPTSLTALTSILHRDPR